MNDDDPRKPNPTNWVSPVKGPNDEFLKAANLDMLSVRLHPPELGGAGELKKRAWKDYLDLRLHEDGAHKTLEPVTDLNAVLDSAASEVQRNMAVRAQGRNVAAGARTGASAPSGSRDPMRPARQTYSGAADPQKAWSEFRHDAEQHRRRAERPPAPAPAPWVTEGGR